MYKRNKNRLIVIIIGVISIGVTNGGAFAGGLLDVKFGDVPFTAPLVLDNPYWPLNPDNVNRTFTYIGETEDECAIDQISVNDNFYGATYNLATDNVDSPYYDLTVLQVVDTEWVFEDVEVCDLSLLPDNSAIKEKTLDWYMQDDQENIWYMGEYSQSFEDECAEYPFDPTGAGIPDECKEGSWEAGVVGGEGDEAVTGEAGIVVPGDFPLPGERLKNGTYYMQEVAFEAEDMAKILRQHASLSVEDGVEPGEYEECRKAKEWTALEPGASVEHKWYCADGAGLVMIVGIGGGPTEVEVLVDISPALP